jgi:4-amino-4-deoxychorismate lyase
MNPRALVDGMATDQVPVDDRGLRYGDGVFETVRIADGVPIWWDAHLARLERGCVALGLAMPPTGLLAAELACLFPAGGDGVLRLQLTRGDGERGYRPESGTPSRRILVRSAVPPPLRQPLAVGWAGLRLAIQPQLAGLKHLNRLEQVLAARECVAQGFDDVLVMDADDAVTCGVASNLFLVRDGRLQTPLLDRCGIAGTCRGWLLAAHPDVRVARLSRAEVEQADELFLCNSVRGILPVRRLGDRELPPGPFTRALARQLAREVPAFRHAGESTPADTTGPRT